MHSSDFKQNVMAKDWSEQDRKKTLDILDKSHSKKANWILFLDELICWAVLVFALIGNLVLSAIFMPIMLVSSSTWLYPIIMVMAVGFGLIFYYLLHEIEHLDHHHHLIAAIIIPVISIVGMFVVTTYANNIASIIKVYDTTQTLAVQKHSPVLVGITYAIFFAVPYFYYSFGHHKKLIKFLEDNIPVLHRFVK